MRVSIGSDHRGLPQRQVLTEILTGLGHEVDDQGSFTEESCDYPDIAVLVSREIQQGRSDRGILVCGTGIGMSMAANRLPGIRAALVHDVPSALLSRQHNNSNVLCLAGNDFDPENYREIVTAWMATEFEGGRHQRRVDKIEHLND